MRREDFVCFLRNPARSSWALCLAREVDAGERKPFYPDFIIVRKDAEAGYVLDILEPHNESMDDNVSKAKALAQYAAENPIVRRVQLIRMARDAIGAAHFVRLDMTKSEVRKAVMPITNSGELDHLFDMAKQSCKPIIL